MIPKQIEKLRTALASGEIPPRLPVIVASFVGLIIVAAILVFQSQKERIRSGRSEDLAAISRLKAAHIATWYAERMGDAMLLSHTAHWRDSSRAYLATRSGAEMSHLREHMRDIVRHYGYADIIITDAAGTVLFGVDDPIPHMCSYVRTLIARAVRENTVLFSDIYRCPDDGDIFCDFIVPLSGAIAAPGPVSTCAVIRVDPRAFLFPLIQEWPTPSETAETLLVRRDGDDVLYLNELRHRKVTALSLRNPINRPALPTAMAVRGVTGIVEGMDYRGVEVLADLRGIDGTPWHLVSKVDISEVYRSVRVLFWMILVIGTLVIAGTLSIAGYWWKRRSANYFRRQYEAEVRLRALRFHYEYLTRYANDIIVLGDENLRIIEANDRAVEVYGYSRKELFEMDVHALRAPESATGLEDQVAAVTRDGGSVYETVHRRKDGSTFPVEVSARLIEVLEKRFYQAIIRDISERKRIENALWESQRMYATLVSSLPGFVYRCRNDRKWTMAFISDGCYAITGYTPEDFIDNRTIAFNDIVEHERRDELWSKWQDALSAREEFEDSYRIITKSGLYRWVWERGRGVFADSGELLFLEGFITDVTALKESESNLQKATERFQTAFEYAPTGMTITGTDGRFIDCNTAFCAMLGYTREELAGIPFNDITHPDDRDISREQLLRVIAGTIDSAIFEKRYLHKSGAVIWVLLSAALVKTPDPQDSYCIAHMIDITQRKRAEDQLRLDEMRFSALYELGRMQNTSEKDIIDFALEEGVRLTGSEVGYAHFIEDDQVSLELFTWSRAALERCTAEKMRHYPVESAGIWADSLRTKRVVFHNDYPNHPDRKGYPEGHFPVMRHMSVPVLDGDRVVLVAGVGNKAEPYDESDALQLELLMDGMWKVVQRTRSDERIRASLREKEILLKEVHHRVKNNMQVIASMINLQFRDFEKTLARLTPGDISRDLQGRIRSMAMIHEKLYQSGSFTSVNFGDYARNLGAALFRSYQMDETRVKLAIDAADVPLGVDAAIPCGLILNELISNALKYAFPDGSRGAITVVLRPDEGGGYRLTVADDGVGLPDSVDIANIDTLGLRLVVILAEQIEGTLSLSRDGGTACTIVFRRSGLDERGGTDSIR